MARGFRRTRHGVRAKLDVQERAVLAHLFVEVYELLDDGAQADPDPLAALVGIGTSVDLPDDPALARLLPDAHKEDPEASSEFRRYTEQGLRHRKRQALETARLTLGRDGALTLDDAEQQAWLTGLTDVRLVLAERMGLRTEEDHERLMRLLGIPLDELDESGGEPSDRGAPDAGDGQDRDPVEVDDLDEVEVQDQVDALDDDADRGQGSSRPASGLPGAGELFGQAVDESFGVDAEASGRGDGGSSPGAADPGSTSDALDRLDDAHRVQLATMLSLYDFLTWLQETLVQAVCDD